MANNDGLSAKQRSFVHASLKKLPEGAYVNPQKCTHCGECISACPAPPSSNIFRKRDGIVYVVANPDMGLCPGNWECGKCVEICPEGAISISKAFEHKVA